MADLTEKTISSLSTADLLQVISRSGGDAERFISLADLLTLLNAASGTLTNKTLTTPLIASLLQQAGKTLTMPIPSGAADTLVALALQQTLTNKTLTAPVLTLKNTVVVNAVASSLSTNLAGTNNDLVYTAKVKGVSGDAISVTYLGGTDKVFGITVVGNDITVQLATTGTTITTIADHISAEITSGVTAGGVAARALVTCVDKAGNDGSEVVIAMIKTQLASGVNGTVGIADELRSDRANHKLWFCEATNTIADANWVSFTKD